MRVPVFLLMLVATAWSGSAQEPADNPYRTPLEPVGFEAHAVVAPPVAPPGEEILKTTRLAVEIRVELADYLPRGLEPVLVIGGEPVETPTRIVSVEDGVTTLGFLVDEAALLREGASLAVQMGDEESTRAALPATLRLRDIAPLDAEAARELGLPDLRTWLDQADEEKPE